MSRSGYRSYRWIFYTTSGLLYVGTVLRSLFVMNDDASLLLVTLLLLLAWLALFVTEAPLSRRWSPWFHVYLVLQTVIVVVLLAQTGSHDFFAVLFGVLAMHALERYGLTLGAVCVAVFVPCIALPLIRGSEPAEVVNFALVYTAVNVIFGCYALATRRAAEARAENQAVGLQLQAANTALRDYSSQLERLAVAQERNRVARELHDSVTQTIFSMTLASQSAAIQLERQPAEVDAQLERLGQLTQSALAEMHVLISELAPDAASDALVAGGLAAAIRRDIQRRAADGMQVSLEVEEPSPESPTPAIPATAIPADGKLTVSEEQGLLRIAQEALNNSAKHSGATEAAIRLRLRDPFSMEIEDRGRGFDVQEARDGPGIGLASMSERAAEIGWDIDVVSGAGMGTKVVVRRLRRGEETHGRG